MSFSIIAAVGQNNELGKAGGLVFNLKEDMKFFKNTTTGHPVDIPGNLSVESSLIVKTS